MKVSWNAEALKFAGGAIIVGAALCIMLPDLVRYLAGLWRLGVLVVAVIALAWALAMARIKLAGSAGAKIGPAAAAGDEGPLKSSEEAESS